MREQILFKKKSILLWLIFLVLSLSAISFYNYHQQKNLLLNQMKSDANDISGSIVAAIKRFKDIKSTMNLQKLVNDMSLGLDIFEFRFIAPDGIIENSMFKEEIGKIYESESFHKTMQGDMPIGKFFFETRDYVKVMAIYYPISLNNDLIGIIDLAVEVPQYSSFHDVPPEVILSQRKIDILNLLKAIEGSILNSIRISRETDIDDFLYKYVQSAQNILQITMIDEDCNVISSSNKALIGKKLQNCLDKNKQIIDFEGKPVYRIVSKSGLLGPSDRQIMLLIDAAPYKKNESRLLKTASFSSILALLIALFIARAIYISAKKESQEEKERLEKLVQERTKEIELLSKTDALTKLWNRRYLEEMLQMEFKRARRYNHDLSLIVVDLDHFKKINDTYGHIAGDEVLKEVAKRIKKSLRETDFVGRYGGEEIVVILPETDAEKAFNIAQKIKKALESEPVLFNGTEIKVTASLGISQLRKEHNCYERLFHEADEALYEAKRRGRNTIVVYAPAGKNS